MASGADVVTVLCRLLESSADAFEASAIADRHRAAVAFLVQVGVLMPAERPSVTRCRACDADHPAVLEFDAATARYSHFCPEAGRVPVDNADLATLRVDLRFLLDWLTTKLAIVGQSRWRELAADRAWYLGEAIVAATSVAVVLARRLSSQADLDVLAAALPPIQRDSIGIVLVPRADLPRHIELPYHFTFLDLGEILRASDAEMSIERANLVGWIKGMTQGLKRPIRDRPGRPSDRELVEQIERERRGRGEPYLSQAAEARAIQIEISRLERGGASPAHKTIAKHLRALRIQ